MNKRKDTGDVPQEVAVKTGLSLPMRGYVELKQEITYSQYGDSRTDYFAEIYVKVENPRIPGVTFNNTEPVRMHLTREQYRALIRATKKQRAIANEAKSNPRLILKPGKLEIQVI